MAPKDQPEPEWSPLSGLGQGALAAVGGSCPTRSIGFGDDDFGTYRKQRSLNPKPLGILLGSSDHEHICSFEITAWVREQGRSVASSRRHSTFRQTPGVAHSSAIFCQLGNQGASKTDALLKRLSGAMRGGCSGDFRVLSPCASPKHSIAAS